MEVLFISVRDFSQSFEMLCDQGRHLITNHPDLRDKPITCFHAKINSVKRIKLDSTSHF